MSELFAPNGNKINGVLGEAKVLLEVDGKDWIETLDPNQSPKPIMNDGEYVYVDVRDGRWKKDQLVKDPEKVTVRRLKDEEVMEEVTIPVDEVLDGVHDDRLLFIDHAASKEMGLEVPDEVDEFDWQVELE